MKAERAVLECGLAANDALSAYVAIHDRIFAEQATLLSLLKNLIGKGVSFEALLEDAEAANQLWIDVYESANAARDNYRELVSTDEAEFLAALVEYAAALLATTAILVERQQLLLKRKHHPNEVAWETFTDVQRRYDAAVTRYMELGRPLNARMQRVFALAELRLRTGA